MVQDAEKLNEWKELCGKFAKRLQAVYLFCASTFSTVRFADKASPPLHHQYLLISKLDGKDAKYSSSTGTT